ncbi:MAG: YhcN/YlaJ family sporulation lipoprotein [Bacillota bacterium]
MQKKKFLSFLILAVFVLLAVTGCPAQRKPQPQDTQPGPTAQEPSRLPTNPNEMTRMTDGLAREASKVQGVESSTVVLTFNTALVGLNLKPGADENAVKAEVGKVIKNQNNLIKNVLVTTDPELNSRLVRISRGIAEGRPADSFQKEIDELRDRLSPTAR